MSAGLAPGSSSSRSTRWNTDRGLIRPTLPGQVERGRRLFVLVGLIDGRHREGSARSVGGTAATARSVVTRPEKKRPILLDSYVGQTVDILT